MNRTALYLALGAAALYLLTRPRRAMAAAASSAEPVRDLVPTYTGGSGGVATVRPAVTPAPTEGGAPAVPDKPAAERSPVTNVTVDITEGKAINSTRDLVRTTMPVPTVTVDRVGGIRRA